jgi:hypothetical protein
MSKGEPDAIFDSNVATILEQQGFVWEESPRSIYDPSQLYTALERYATEWDQFEKMDDAMRYGFGRAYKIFSKPKSSSYLRILTDDEIPSKALKLSKSAGLPMMTTKRESLTYSFDREQQVRLGLKAPNPCVAYKRTQAGNKTRLVWGYPLEMTIMEARFARPLIQNFMTMATPMAFGMTKCELGAKLHRYFVDEPGTVVCMDYSKYDSTISKTMINYAFRIMATWFPEQERERLGWDIVRRYFVATPIVMPDGHLYTGKNHGVPSGSYFTQMVDSIVNVALTYALAYRFHFNFNHRSLYVLGDDVIVNVNGPIELERWAKYLKSFGLVLHDDEKTLVGRVHFLGAFWDMGKPDAPIQELVNKACFPEKFRDYQGKPDSGSEAVLRSYATSYLSAFRFLPTMPASIRSIDMPVEADDLSARWLSGSDKYLLEERRLSMHVQRGVGPRTLAVRVLL